MIYTITFVQLLTTGYISNDKNIFLKEHWGKGWMQAGFLAYFPGGF